VLAPRERNVMYARKKAAVLRGTVLRRPKSAEFLKKRLYSFTGGALKSVDRKKKRVVPDINKEGLRKRRRKIEKLAGGGGKVLQIPDRQLKRPVALQGKKVQSSGF